MAKPSVDGLERSTQGRLNVVRVDVETPSAALVAARYVYRFTPTYILVDREGREVWRQVGGSPPHDVIEARIALMH